jgi:hypothetical protein
MTSKRSPNQVPQTGSPGSDNDTPTNSRLGSVLWIVIPVLLTVLGYFVLDGLL